MGEKLIIGPDSGQRTNREPFYIDNDSFSKLINSYQWRKRVKRKRGTSLLTRFQRTITVTDITLTSGSVNLITALSLQSNSAIALGSINLVGSDDGTTYTDPSKNGTLLATGGTGTGGTINYATGVISINAGGSQDISGSFTYYPGLPSMGLEDLSLTANDFPNLLGFDTTYAYNIPITSTNQSYDVSFYKNPATGTYDSYVAKTDWTPVTWNGRNYQQFWSTNYENAFWATNGITVPFVNTNIGMQYKNCETVVYASATTLTITITESIQTLVIGDFVFINEVTGTDSENINFQTGYITAASNDGTTTTLTVKFPDADIQNQTYSAGILQYLTSNLADPTKDCIRWYDGDPTGGSPPTPTTINGWVNFCPPLFNSANPNFGPGGIPPAQYYLVGARIIIPFKDRLLCFGAVVQTSSPSSQVYLGDTVIYSQNGTPYYTASFTGDPSLPTTIFNPILVPNQTASSASSWFEDQTGFGGFLTAGIQQPINTVSPNEDALIVGFNTQQTRMVYTGNDLVPFNLFLINSEYGSGSTFSIINMDKGVLTKGSRGYVITGQTECQRIDLQIPDQNFKASLTSNGIERVCAQRDFINEWVYFSYPSADFGSPEDGTYIFPTQTLFYNYRDDSWGIFNETYTTYGQFRKLTGETWADLSYLTWETWNSPWDSGDVALLDPDVIAGNQQGFVMVREDESTNEQTSLYISAISGSIITCFNHSLNTDDYIIISGALGVTGVNGIITQVKPIDNDTFSIQITAVGTYIGGGLITRLYIPFIQTKQFPVAWDLGRKTRIGAQQYLLSKTSNAQITLLIFLSQDSADAFNNSPIIPAPNVTNDSLVYSTILYTCPESTNLGLTPANTNLQMIAFPQTGTSGSAQLWHRMNTSLIGDTVQLGFTLSDDQMRALDGNGGFISQFDEIELHSIILDVSPSSLLA